MNNQTKETNNKNNQTKPKKTLPNRAWSECNTFYVEVVFLAKLRFVDWTKVQFPERVCQTQKTTNENKNVPQTQTP